MAPLRSRQVLVWAGLPLTILLSYLWFKRKRAPQKQSDPGKKIAKEEQAKTLEEELKEAEAVVTPTKLFSRSLSGVDSAPIDIVFPPELKSKKANSIIISDEDLDLEIEKIKSMKNLAEPFSKKSNPVLSPAKSSFEPIKENDSPKVVEEPSKNSSENCEKETTFKTESSRVSDSTTAPVKTNSVGNNNNCSPVKNNSNSPVNSSNSPVISNNSLTVSNNFPINSNSSSGNSNNSPINSDNSQVSDKVTRPTTPPKTTQEETTPKKLVRRPKSPKSKSSIQISKTMTESKNKDSPTHSKNMGEDVRDLCETSMENKLNSLHLDTKQRSPKNSALGQEEYHRTSCERDSANHSPADVMLASPSLSSISDNHSEGSSDSGKGGSDVVTPPPSRTPACDGSVSGDVPLHSIYEFLIPQSLVGRLIGRHGCFVTQIKEKTRAHILIKKHPENPKLKVCQIEGTQLEIDTALEMIRDKFPEKRYPELTLEQVSFLPPVSTVPLIPEHLCLKLIEGINNDTIVSCMVAPNHLFLQQPTHPTFPNLNILSNCLNVCYADATSPLLPNPIPENTVCVAHSLGAWYRALVLSTDLESEVSYVKFLDYGGYVNIPNSELRQIRADFLSLPFQASECFLANIRPVGGDDATWPDEAYTLVADLTKGAIIYTQVADYTDDRIPLVLIYVVLGPQSVVFLNGELVTRGFAEWILSEDCSSVTDSTTVAEEAAVAEVAA